MIYFKQLLCTSALLCAVMSSAAMAVDGIVYESSVNDSAAGSAIPDSMMPMIAAPEKIAPLSPDTSAVYHWGGAKQAWQREFSYAGLPLMAAGLLIWQEQDDYRSMRNRFVPKFNSIIDNYSQYSPLAVTAILKACGVRTRSNWGRFAVSSAFSTVIMASMVNGIKYTVKEMRPDNTTANSFPSGHTSTAFMCATIMSKELGWRSPWYSIGAYTVAATTGLFRVLNNRHWINDVVFGAGIGITSADLGYFIGDLIFKDKGIDPLSMQSHIPDIRNVRPSFVSIGMSVGTGTDLHAPDIYDDYIVGYDGEPHPDAGATPLNLKLRMGATTSVAVEGAYFFNSNWGIGGRLRATACPITAQYNHDFSPYVIEEAPDGVRHHLYELDGIESASLGIIGTEAGAYGSLPVGRRWRLGAKMLLGCRLTTDFDLNSYSSLSATNRLLIQDAFDSGLINQSEYEQMTSGIYDTEFMSIETAAAVSMAMGVSVTYALRHNTALRLYADYSYSAPEYTYHLFNRFQTGFATDDDDVIRQEDIFRRRTPMHDFNCGVSVAAMF